ncbi:hypothetical protein MSAN_00303600 [Mycena sanguinolenta]|uniref:Protein kinase domain-containing protein n=1 Tax=Mycena sanguinolenta TaxID=230812 RepID=A0A8H7DG59_9AGAR|nr:hypothetical protein MSAN_00303600 [Mycena sanguinolenta]
MPSVFRGPRQRRKAKIFYISGGTGGTGGEGGTNGGSGGAGEGPRVKFRMVSGKTITNINKNYSTAPAVPSGCRTIPLGDLDLQREIQLDRYSGVVSVRRLYSAKIHAEGTNVAVALYQGDGAEAQWRRDVKKYMVVRHPNIVQLYGTASCGNIHAAVFHDDLIPLQQIFDLYKRSHLSTAYIYAYRDNEFRVVQSYFGAIFGRGLDVSDCTFFIRRSTARFCTHLVPGGESVLWYSDEWDEMSTQRGLGFLAGQHSEATIIDALPLDHYHALSLGKFSTARSMSVTPSTTVNIGSVLHCPSDDTFDDVVEIAWLSNPKLPLYYSWYGSGDWSSVAELMADGWTRLKSNRIVDTTVWLSVHAWNYGLWLSQANHIFTTLQISSNFRDYDCPAYWSLDPSGTEQLTLDEATSLGFPSVQLSTTIWGKSWDASVYAGLHQFHEGKGFDPNSQGVARHLGHPLYQVSGQNRTDTLFAHIEGEHSDNADDGGSTSEHFTNGVPNHEELPLSGTFKFVLSMQLALIFFSVLFWVLFDI